LLVAGHVSAAARHEQRRVVPSKVPIVVYRVEGHSTFFCLWQATLLRASVVSELFRRKTGKEVIFLKRAVCVVIMLLHLILLLAACGGGGSGGDSDPGSSNWDEMQWDSGNWA